MGNSSSLLGIRLNKITIRVMLTLGSLVAAGALLETGVRLLAPHTRDHALPRQLFPADELLGWRLAASERAHHRSQYFEAEYTTNTLGYRDRRRSTSVSESYRLLLYGDSQVFGWGLPVERRFSNLIDARLPNLDIWNLAVPGYGVDQQVLSYIRDAADWHADAVMFYVSEATQFRLHYDYLFGFYKPFFRSDGLARSEVVPPKGGVPRRFLYVFPRWMYTPYYLDQLLSKADQRWRGRSMVPRAQSLELLANILGFASEISDKRGHRMLVVSSLSDDRGKQLRELCAELGIGHLTVGLPAEQDNLVWGEHDPHWNALAHQMIAEHLAGHVSEISGKFVLRTVETRTAM